MGFDLLRMSFPTVTANSSPMSVLPNWVEVLGKKLDKISAELDWYAHCSSSCMQTHNNTTMFFFDGCIFRSVLDKLDQLQAKSS